ncbi:MAG TPA: hypothetical protein PLD82_01300, partial [Spirochaetota bacterium]|nr:hypothetical protein [Spirochaetota bacterium]
GIGITSARGATITLFSNYFSLFYPTPIAPKGGDQLALTIRDGFAQGNTSTSLGVNVKFDTMAYFTNAAVANGTNRIEFVMPEPLVEFGLPVRDIYTTHTNATLRVWVTNRGSGSNLLERFVLTVPGVMSNVMTQVLAAVSTNVTHAPSGLVDARYLQGVRPGQGDVFSIALVNPQHEVGSFTLNAIVSNSTLGDPALVKGVSNILRVVTPPQTRISPNAIDTTTGTNTVEVHINNTGSGDTAVLRARVKIPEVFNRIVSVASTRVSGAAITNLGNEYFVEYGPAAIANGSSDTLTFVLEDGLSHGATNVAWQVQVDNGNGYAMTAESTTGAMAQAFTMPAVAAAGWLNTVWVYAANDPGSVVTNVMTLSFTNRGRGSNNVYRVLLQVPQALSNMSGLMSDRGGVVTVTNSTNVFVSYEGAGFLRPGQKDTLRFTLRHSVNNALSFDYIFKADNDDGNGYVAVTAPTAIAGAQQRLDVFIKEEDPEAYIVGAKAPYIWETVTNTVIYTMDDAATVRYAIKNKSRRFSVNSVVIPLSNTFTVEGITSTLATGSASVAYTHATNTLILRWVGTNFGQQMSDTLTLALSYDKNAFKAMIEASTKSLTNTVTARVRYGGSEQYILARGLQRDKLVVENARFGRIRGVVLPLGLGPTVTLKDTASESIATNVEGKAFQALVNTNTGAYVVDKIPPSLAYRLVVMPPIGETVTNNGRVIVPVNYDTLQVSGVSAVQNTVLQLTNLIMVYGKLNKQATGDQQVICPEDALTKLVVPAGTLFEGISVNIAIEDMTDDQESYANASERVITRPTDSTTLSVWHFKIVNLADNVTLENGFKKDVEIVLHYGDLSSQGWTDDRLGIWYWKPSTKEWVFVGGVVDTQTKTIRARVSYLHTYYAVMATATATTQAIHSVKASPNPFTPGRGDGQFSNMKLSFAFAKAYSSYEVKIFNMQGQLVQHFTRDGSYAQGEVFWDGKDRNGFKVRGGVYVYQIIAGSSVYSGSVLILR